MSAREDCETSSSQKDINFGGCHVKKRCNRIESSSSGQDSEDEVIESSQDFHPLSAIGRRTLLNLFSKCVARSTLEQKRTQRPNTTAEGKKTENDLEEAYEELSSCAQIPKRTTRLTFLDDTQNPLSRGSFKRKHFEIDDDEKEGKNEKIQKGYEDTDNHLESLIEYDTSDSESESSWINKTISSPSKKFIKTPSTTIEWNDSSEDSNADLTIEVSEDTDETATLSSDYTRINAEEVSAYFGLNFVNCTINGKSSVVLIRPRRESIKKGQMVEVALPETAVQVKNNMIYVVDKHRVIDSS